MTQSLADQVAELEDRVAELERENDILRSERDDDVDYERDDDEPSPVQELESVELLRQLVGHLNGPWGFWTVREWDAHLKLLVHQAQQLIEEYDAR